MSRSPVRFGALLLLFALAIVTHSRVTHAAPTLSLWHSYRADEEKALVEVVRRYEKEHGIAVDLLALPFDAFASKLKAAVPHGHGPDLFIDAHQRVGTYLAQDVVASVGDALPEQDVALFDSAAVEAVTKDGKRYGVPLASKCLALYFNRRLLPNPPTSIEALAALQANLPSEVYSLAYETTNPYFHAAFLHAFGGRLLLQDESYGFVGPEAERSVEFVAGLQASRAMPLEPNGALVTRLFAAGQVAAVISGPWLAAEIADRVDYGVVPLPRATREGGEGGVLRPFLTVDTVFASPHGAERPEARAFARWLATGDATVTRALVGKQVVPLAKLWEEPRVVENTLLRAFHDAAKEAVPMPTSNTMQAVWTPAERALRKVLRGDASAHDALLEGLHRFEDETRPPPSAAPKAPAVLLLGLGVLALAAFAVRRIREPKVRRALSRSLPAYKWVTHAALAVFLLVILPLSAGAITSFFAGSRLEPRFVGLANYVDILTARGRGLLGHGSFWLTLLVTVLWTVINLVFHVGIGIVLGLALSRHSMRLRAIYRVVLIVPWAVPNYVTALAWKGMFHRQFGAVNRILEMLGAEPISWFSRFSTAFTANVLTNVWLGFPFMMVVTLGALTSIPKEVMEAAEVDGATRFQRFRLVTFPLLLPALLPSIVLGAVWTFNMFNVIYLVSGGEPDGTTEILVSEAYRWAFTRDTQVGYAAAYAVLIFFILAGLTRGTRKLTQNSEGAAV